MRTALKVVVPGLLARVSGQSYTDYAKSLFGAASIVELWPQNEGSGSTIVGAVNGLNGTYTGVTWDGATFLDGSPAPFYDGVNDCGNVYSGGLAARFNGAEGTLSGFLRVPSGGWANVSSRYPITFRVDSNSFARVAWDISTGEMGVEYRAGGGTILKITKTGLSTLDWFHIALTWSKSADQVKMYFNGVQHGATLTGLGVWSGALNPTTTALGALSTSPSNVHNGHLGPVGILNRAATAQEIAAYYARAAS